MKFMFTKIFAALLIVSGMSMLTLNAQTVIWGGPGEPNSTFDGGFNDWTAVGVSCSNNMSGQPVGAENALWSWAAGANVRSMGAFWGARTPLMSPTVANGAVFFDSDFLDNNGSTTGFGTGTCPSPHVAELISPVIDLSGTQSAAITFYQYYRRFGGPGGAQDAVASYIHVSVDGGATWVPFTVNSTVVVNGETTNGNRALVDITSLAAGQSNVQFKFVWDGEYYYWLIDDVEIVTLPDNNISLSRHFYAPTTLFTPETYTEVDTFLFSAAVSNLGGNEVDAWLKASITNPTNTETFWADSVLVNIPTGTLNRVDSIPTFFVPNELDPAEYRIRYELYQEGVADFEPSDNVRQSPFVITNNNFWQSGAQRVYNRPAGDPQAWGFGALFVTDSNTVERYAVSAVEFSVAGENGAASLEGKRADFFLLNILTNGFFGQGIGLADGTTSDYAAYAEIELTPAQERQVISLDLISVENDPERFEITNGEVYFGVVIVDAEVLINFDNAFINYPIGLEETLVSSKSRLFIDNVFSGAFRNSTPFIRFNMELISNTDQQPLPEAAVQLMPNPASSFTSVKVDLEKASNITITLADLSGRVVSYENFSNVTQFTHELNVSNMPAGTYLVRVASEYGTKTQKLVVIH